MLYQFLSIKQKMIKNFIYYVVDVIQIIFINMLIYEFSVILSCLPSSFN